MNKVDSRRCGCPEAQTEDVGGFDWQWREHVLNLKRSTRKGVEDDLTGVGERSRVAVLTLLVGTRWRCKSPAQVRYVLARTSTIDFKLRCWRPTSAAKHGGRSQKTGCRKQPASHGFGSEGGRRVRLVEASGAGAISADGDGDE